MQRNDNIKDYSRVEFLIFIEPGVANFLIIVLISVYVH